MKKVAIIDVHKYKTMQGNTRYVATIVRMEDKFAEGEVKSSPKQALKAIAKYIPDENNVHNCQHKRKRN